MPLQLSCYHLILVISGEGPFLKLFSKDGKLLCTNEVLPFKVVHGIRPLQSG